MTKRAFDRIAAGLEAAIDYADGRANLDAYRIHVPSVDVATLRDRLLLSQAQFASRFGFAIDDVRAWEKGSRPEGALRTYLLVIERDPEAVSRALGEQTAA